MRSRLKWASRVTCVERMGGEKGSDAQKVEETRYEEHRRCDGRTALRQIWKHWEEN